MCEKGDTMTLQVEITEKEIIAILAAHISREMKVACDASCLRLIAREDGQIEAQYRELIP